ncbi:MAG: DUF4870 domain-containing protein [Bacillota bacterium]|uniref:DUF4870 domain-containing protein n=1 Tax=Virgibacillus salarius TaxID=447199 RepID=A0A941DXB8_9BACI|nr:MULTISPECIES: DUF4870 domain-containing protein [Bacillaceae]NAZ09936.1 DUF4870 domain-containing protein [Agaribacter marinus]MBR7797227.1 DUF4870 domain-containing protein [Virgibacillus salarius]MCC2250158.1 DUF4870 domain-containing protein [Virgibacillus sp. AGTR]MDY7045719.1 DUF4870 domain-containing protein [Virgibacillus sp. M23]QRZ19040.1 DUF4870 domain-containing protein [Virgibacillus sp. AGTR]
MKPNNILSSLSYFSIFFAPFLFPIIVYFVADKSVKHHAIKALWAHLVPFITIVCIIVIAVTLGISQLSQTVNGGILIGVAILAVIVNVYFFIWNLVRGIKVLNEN